MAKPRIPRKTILKNSLNMFKTKGFHGTSMSDLAAANGILKGSMYHYIESKEKLMKDVLQALHQHYTNKVFSKAYSVNLSPAEKLEAMFKYTREIVTFNNSGDFFANIGLETQQSNPEFASTIQSFYADWKMALHTVYKNWMTDDEAKEKSKQTLVELQGAITMSKLMDDFSYFDSFIAKNQRTYVEMKVA